MVTVEIPPVVLVAFYLVAGALIVVLVFLSVLLYHAIKLLGKVVRAADDARAYYHYWQHRVRQLYRLFRFFKR